MPIANKDGTIVKDVILPSMEVGMALGQPVPQEAIQVSGTGGIEA